MKAGLTGLVAMVLMACGNQGSTLSGTMTVNNPMGSSQAINGTCTGKQGFEDLHGGTAVVVKDESGKILATGSLGTGTAPDRLSCRFAFTLVNIADAKFYQVEVAHRGVVTYSKADLDKAGWKVALSLG